MTNEEKAKEISWNHHKEYQYEGCDGLEYFDDSVVECEASALEMAEWKDAQFKEYLEDRLDSVKNYSVCSRSDDFHEGMIEMLDDIITDLFRE